MQPGESWRRLERRLTPRSPTDWRRYSFLTVAFVAVSLAMRLILSLLFGNGLSLSGAQSVANFAYLFVGVLWWRSYFQEVQEHGNSREVDQRLRRLLIRGAAVWVVLAYVLLFALLTWYAADEPSGSSDDADASGPLLLFVFLLPLGQAVFTAFLGRMSLVVRPPHR